MPPHQFLPNFRISLAKRLLEEERIKVSDLAVRLGFSDAHHFSLTFKSKTGTTPAQWRR